MTASTISKSPSIPTAVRQVLDNLLSEFPVYGHEFSYKIGWAANHDLLFRGELDRIGNIETLLEAAFRTGRVFLYGRGGGGKTAILQRLFRIAVERGMVPVAINLKDWTAKDYERWSRIRASETAMLSHVLRRFARPPLSMVELDYLSPHLKKLFLVDGLNEVRTGVADEIVALFDGVARDLIGSGVIISDRIVRRNLRSVEHWLLASVLPLADEEIDAQLSNVGLHVADLDDSTKALLGLPFFLNEMLESRHLVPTGSEALRDYFDQHVSLSDDQVLKAADAAFAMYGATKTRTFPLDQFTAIAGADVVERLKAADAIVVANGSAKFDHHLKHDYLVSRYLAATRKWSSEEFKIASFDASSFDTLVMVPEQLDREDADSFISRLYDWSLYGTAYVIAEGYQRHSARVSREMETVILAMLSEKRWDVFEATSQKATDSLNLFPTAEAQRFRQAQSLQSVFELVNEVKSQDTRFLRWRSIFTTPPNERVSESDLKKVVGDDSVEGWTIANVLKRRDVSSMQQGQLRDSYRGSAQPVRWRIVHVLGAFPTELNAQFLAHVLAEDLDSWVRYGAVRSIVEVAARSEQLRVGIFEALSQSVTVLLRDSHVLGEFRRSLYLREPPDDWSAVAAKAVVAVYREVEDSRSADVWLQTLHDLETKSYARV